MARGSASCTMCVGAFVNLVESVNMDTPDLTKAQVGAGGVFLAILTLAIQSGMTGLDLLTVAASSAIVAVGAMYADARVRNGRAHAHGLENQGVQSTMAAFDRGSDSEGEG